MASGSSARERLISLASLAFLTFLYGFAASHFEWFPHRYVSRAFNEAEALLVNDPHHLFPRVYDEAGAFTLDPSSVQPGVTLYWFGQEYTPFEGMAWVFVMLTGSQHEGVKDHEFFAWPVRDGDVAAAAGAR